MSLDTFHGNAGVCNPLPPPIFKTQLYRNVVTLAGSLIGILHINVYRLCRWECEAKIMHHAPKRFQTCQNIYAIFLLFVLYENFYWISTIGWWQQLVICHVITHIAYNIFVKLHWVKNIMVRFCYSGEKLLQYSYCQILSCFQLITIHWRPCCMMLIQ